MIEYRSSELLLFLTLAPIVVGAVGSAPVAGVTDAVTYLPLVELPAAGTDTLAIIVSGDGGWASIDREIASYLTSKGVAVVGLNTLRYFWNRRTPEGAAKDLERIMAHYLHAWGKREAVLIGYSMGADVLPFMVSRLSAARRAPLRALVLLAPSARATFEFHFSNWLGRPAVRDDYALLPELAKLRGLPVLCIGGADERASLCRQVDAAAVHVQILPGTHHFGGDYRRLAEVIARFLSLP